MFLVGLISWWYGRGWMEQVRRSGGMLLQTLEFFSIGQLITTLFSPFRQISVGSGGAGSLSMRFSALLDRLFSRVVGAFIRSFTILAGAIVIVIQSVYAGLIMALWLVVPVLPLIGLAAYLLGWMPYGI